MLTLKDIAREAGVSARTASMVLRGKEREGRISGSCAGRVRDVAGRLGYRVHAAARATRSGATRMIGILWQPSVDQATPSIGAMHLASHVCATLDRLGYTACLVPLADIVAGEGSRAFREHILDGMLVVNNVPVGLGQQITKLTQRVVWVDHNCHESVNCVWRDEVAAGATVVSKAFARGYRRVLYVNYAVSGGHYSEIDRRAGVLETATRLGMHSEEFLLEHGVPLGSPPERLVSLERGDLVVTYSVAVARDVAMLASQAGLRCGREYGLACCEDDMTAWSSFRSVSHVQFNRADLGACAARMMVSILEHPAKPVASVRSVGEWVDGGTLPPID